MLRRFVTILITFFLSALHALTPDHQLAQDIQDRLHATSQNYRHITVDVKDGTVTLQGKVRTEADKEKIDTMVRKAQGVHEVISQINVYERKSDKSPSASYPEDSYSTSEDEELNKKIRNATSTFWIWNSYKGVSLNASNGIVTVDGKVDSAADEQYLLKAIAQVKGVKSVRSNLEIENN